MGVAMTYVVVLILAFSPYAQHPTARVLIDHIATRQDCETLASMVNAANTTPGARAVCIARSAA